MTTTKEPLANPLPRGSIAIAHIEKSGYSMLAGRYTYSRYFIVRVASASRDGRVKTFSDNPVTSVARKADRYCTIYACSDSYRDAAAALWSHQALDFTGYETKEDMRAALVNAGARVPARIPPCAASMGCLCAGHARGNPACEPCDTTE